MNIIALIISLISGAVGGNVAGAAMKEKSLGVAGNSLAGVVGGGLGGIIMQMLGFAQHAATTGSSSMDIGAILANIAGGGVGGGALMAIIAAIKGGMKKA